MARARTEQANATTSTDEDEDLRPAKKTRASRRVANFSSRSNVTKPTQKQPSIVLSDDDEELENLLPSSPDVTSNDEATPQKQIAKEKAANKKHSCNAPSKIQSPRKSKPKSNGASAASTASKRKPAKTLYSFFNAATQRQQSQGSVSPRKRQLSPVIASPEEEDLIQDDSLDEDLVRQGNAAAPCAKPVQKRRRKEEVPSTNGLVQGSQKFLKSSSNRTVVQGSQKGYDGQERRDNRPWVDKYAPVNLEELAVHRKKVSDVYDWLNGAIGGQHPQRVLVLRGSAGTGKTITLKLIARSLGINVREWHNPSSTEFSPERFVSVASQFDDFIGSSGRYAALELSRASRIVHPSQKAFEPNSDRDYVTVVEEFPNAFIRSGSSLQAFRSTIMRFLAANTPSVNSLFAQKEDAPSLAPIIMIVTETMLTNSSASIDSFTAQRLLGSEILAHPGTTVIDFNPIAPSILTKALEIAIRKEARESGRRRAPGPAVLKHLSEIGDVRSAVSALEFICLRGDDPDAWSGRVAATASKGKKGGTSNASSLTDVERKSLEVVTQRENALGIFHAVGKVVYNKREAPAATDTPPPQPPSYISQHSRGKVPENNVNDLLDELGTDVQTFIAALHENYVLSCSVSDSGQTQDTINGCIDSLSNADLLCSDNVGANRLFRRAFRGNTEIDNLRQEELSYQAAVRGLLFNLPYPVRRVPPPLGLQRPNQQSTKSAVAVGGGSDAAKMYFPASLKLWRQKDEIEGMVDVLLDKMQRGELNTSSTVSGASGQSRKFSGVEAFRRNYSALNFSTPPSSAPKPEDLQAAKVKDDERSALLHMVGASAKAELVLERLPYVGMVYRATSRLSGSTVLKQIEQVTRFSGQASQEDEEDTDMEDDGQDGLPTGPPTKLVHRTKKSGEQHFAGGATVTDEVLVLSDDDIEDD